ncbi:MAG: ATP synthase F1 subunit delta [Acholeplasmataceae bacterium]
MDHKRHVLALYETAQEQNKLDEVIKSIESFNHVFTQELESYLDSPLVSQVQKLSLLKSFNLDPVTNAWLTMLIKSRQAHEFKAFHHALTRHIRALNKEVHVDVFVAKALNESSQKNVQLALTSFFDTKDITLHIHIDENLIGGMKIMHQGLSLDQTILNMLDELQTVI